MRWGVLDRLRVPSLPATPFASRFSVLLVTIMGPTLRAGGTTISREAHSKANVACAFSSAWPGGCQEYGFQRCKHHAVSNKAQTLREIKEHDKKSNAERMTKFALQIHQEIEIKMSERAQASQMLAATAVLNPCQKRGGYKRTEARRLRKRAERRREGRQSASPAKTILLDSRLAHSVSRALHQWPWSAQTQPAPMSSRPQSQETIARQARPAPKNASYARSPRLYAGLLP